MVGILDGVGLALFIPLLQSTEGMSAGGSASMGKLSFIVDAIEAVGLSINLNTVLVLMLILFLVKGVLKFWEKYYNAKVRQFFLRKMRYELIDGLNRLRYMHFTTSDSGRIQNVLTGEVQKVMMAYNQYFLTAQNLVLVMVYVALAFLSNWQFAILVLIAGIATNFVYRLMYKLTKKWSSKVSKDGHAFQGFIIQSVSYYKYLKATNGIQKYAKKLKEKIDSIEDANLQMGKIGAILMGSREAFTIAILLIVILIQVNVFNDTITSLVLSLLFFYRSMGYIMQMQTTWNTFLTNSGAMASVQAFIKEMKEQKEERTGKLVNDSFEELTIKDLSFFYGNNQILDKVNLSIAKNTSLAIVGESGSGKTTLVNIISGLMDQYQGSIIINGNDFKSMNTRKWQNKIGYITQEPVIFDDTIANNISFWDDMSIPENQERLVDAMKKAAIYDYVQSLDNKENSRLGTNGVMVSGGQKQRISIARELYKKVDLLIMDEATSALDSETEKMIQENIEALKGHYTMIIIAHRLSTIKNADKVILLDKGKIISDGTFNDLLDNSERFKKMVELQEF